MRKSIKVCLILGIVFVAVGTGTAIAAVALGASVRNETGYIKDVIESNRNVILSDTGSNLEESYTFSGIEVLKIDENMGDVSIVVSDSPDMITVSYTQNDGSVKLRESGDTLEVECKSKKRWGFAINDSNLNVPVIEIAIPEDYEFHKVELDMGASTCYVESINANELDIDAGVGDITITNGNVKKMDIDGAVGKISYSGIISGDADINCGVGNVELEVQGREEEFNYEIECGVGAVHVGDNDYSGIASERRVNNHADKKMEIDCSVGSVDISFYE